MMNGIERICYLCKHRAIFDGRMCGIDWKPQKEHIEQRYCPLGRYRLGLGDVIAMITHRTGIQWVLRKIRQGKPCGCKARQVKLNRGS